MAALALASAHNLSAAVQKGMAGSEVVVPHAGKAQAEAEFLGVADTVLGTVRQVSEGRTQSPQVGAGAAAHHGDSVD